ncbi:FadD3 family acyl-CoA ligase [Rhodococcus sp. IEGM 1366]|uniref:FadD3 family acyl-CoA ligase n=1 Tax=Rhodococcus sp. IEGM 1366 TaxID=3082223 RepID=UPI0029540262|nr:FadD3 family acyl-CoA ligase [Rhodococcus sp. IEGM 1366]MDV8071020.1 FadD3 family acyl-CoA ligase [Rhodococcus sp. IEGM 1366]
MANASALHDVVPSTIPAALDRAVRLWPEQTAVVDGDRRVTWPELADRAEAVSTSLVGSGVQPGDRVALWAPNSLDWIATALGVYMAGAVLLPINTRFKAPEAAHVLRTAEARLLITVTDFLGNDYLDVLSRDEALAASMELVILSGPAGTHTTWAEFLKRTQQTTKDEVSRRISALTADDPSDIVFTSGTTGLPKGAVLTHGAGTRMYTEWSARVGLQHGDRYLALYPFFHCAGLKSVVLACILKGATIVPCPVFDVDTVMRLVERERITMLPGPPTLYQSMLAADLSGYDKSSLRAAVTGASVVPMELVRRMHSELGFATVVTAYGLTETTGTVTTCRFDDPVEVIASTSGRPVPGMEVRVVNPSGDVVDHDESGEILVRGFAVTPGYFADDEATTATIDEKGWLHTGDLGAVDAGGNLRITGRIKDMFIVGGFNAYPAEIENVLLGHSEVAQAAVVGVPDERLGEVGFAFVVPKPGSTPSPVELFDHCSQRLANFKVPRRVELVPGLPLNPSGKVVKFELRDRAIESMAKNP